MYIQVQWHIFVLGLVGSIRRQEYLVLLAGGGIIIDQIWKEFNFHITFECT